MWVILTQKKKRQARVLLVFTHSNTLVHILQQNSGISLLLRIYHGVLADPDHLQICVFNVPVISQVPQPPNMSLVFMTMYLSQLNSNFQNEAKCKTFVRKMSFMCIKIKNHFQINGFALSLTLKQRLEATGKWTVEAVYDASICSVKNEKRFREI